MADPEDMTSYPESMQPVSFPTAAAQEAADECRAVAQLLFDKMDVSSTAAATATAGWRGAYADDFDIAWPGTEMTAEDLHERLMNLAGEFEDAIQAAADENTRREGLRADYDCLQQQGAGSIPC